MHAGLMAVILLLTLACKPHSIKAQPLHHLPKHQPMAHQIKATYRQALALYYMAQQDGYSVATLLHYGGLVHNRPPRRLIVVQKPQCCRHLQLQPSLADDVRQQLQPQDKAASDPLFPHKPFRYCVVDQLV